MKKNQAHEYAINRKKTQRKVINWQ